MLRDGNKLKELLGIATGCTIQHDGWTCGTCFYPAIDELNLSEEDSHLYWLTVLFFRGDYYDFDWAEHHDNLHKFPRLLIELINKLEEEYGNMQMVQETNS